MYQIAVCAFFLLFFPGWSGQVQSANGKVKRVIIFHFSPFHILCRAEKKSFALFSQKQHIPLASQLLKRKTQVRKSHPCAIKCIYSATAPLLFFPCCIDVVINGAVDANCVQLWCTRRIEWIIIKSAFTACIHSVAWSLQRFMQQQQHTKKGNLLAVEWSIMEECEF